MNAFIVEMWQLDKGGPDLLLRLEKIQKGIRSGDFSHHDAAILLENVVSYWKMKKNECKAGDHFLVSKCLTAIRDVEVIIEYNQLLQKGLESKLSEEEDIEIIEDQVQDPRKKSRASDSGETISWTGSVRDLLYLFIMLHERGFVADPMGVKMWPLLERSFSENKSGHFVPLNLTSLKSALSQVKRNRTKHADEIDKIIDEIIRSQEELGDLSPIT